MPIIAKFKDSDHPTKDSVYLTVVSMDGEKQMGDNFNAFISRLNNPESRCVKLIVVVSGKLKEHYNRLYKNLTEEKLTQLSKEMDDKWINENLAALDSLKFEYEILRWGELLPKYKKKFKTFFDIIKEDYERKDEEFKAKVDQHSGSYYAEKLYVKLQKEIPNLALSDCKIAAINYVLEECAFLVILNSLSDYLTYPREMNPCFNHIYNKYIKYISEKEEHIQYREYKLKTIKLKPAMRYEEHAQAIQIGAAPDRCALPSEAENVSCRKGVVKATAEEGASALRAQDELEPNFNRVVRPNFGGGPGKIFGKYNSLAVSGPSLTCNNANLLRTGFFSNREEGVSKRGIRLHISNTTKKLLNNVSDKRAKVILKSFDVWAANLKNEEEPCINRKYSL